MTGQLSRQGSASIPVTESVCGIDKPRTPNLLSRHTDDVIRIAEVLPPRFGPSEVEVHSMQIPPRGAEVSEKW
jgi:hypothetical protein